MHNLFAKSSKAIGAGLLGLAIALVPGGIWGGLYMLNLRTGPSVPWAVVPMAFALWMMWQYLSGKGRPHSTSPARFALLRARPVAAGVFAWSLVAGALAIVALAGYWIVMFQLVKMPGNVLPNFGSYPLFTISLFVIMGSLVSPLSEEAGLRGYCQGILEREFRGPIAVAIASVFFAFGHVNHGLLWPKLTVYFLSGIAFGTIAYLTKSILPGIPVHMLGDLTFFALVWPYDTARRVIWERGADGWFWIHGAQALIFTALAILAYRKLARITADSRHANPQNSFDPSTLTAASISAI
ncbi:MAG TPA: CPBP family intramembrane glutamic endopeptidase [Bryobacteraceae bacterium]|nr:CPBP family intramembrane glutamic endopeptidase [Bryobacteraceae bacterium]